MATSVKRTPFITPRSSKAYRLEMEGRTIFFLLGMLILTGVVIFALGLVTGMGLREPGEATPLATAPPPEPEQPPAETSLVFNEGVKRGETVIEGLQLEQDRIAGKTRRLMEQAEKVLTLEEVPGKTLRARPPANKAAAAGRQPAAVPPAPAVYYTVQVFSSRNRPSAQELLLRLKKQGFSAYLNQYQSSDRKTWYRVRVGKTGRTEAEGLARRLRADANMKAPHIVRL